MGIVGVLSWGVGCFDGAEESIIGLVLDWFVFLVGPWRKDGGCLVIGQRCENHARAILRVLGSSNSFIISITVSLQPMRREETLCSSSYSSLWDMSRNKFRKISSPNASTTIVTILITFLVSSLRIVPTRNVSLLEFFRYFT